VTGADQKSDTDLRENRGALPKDHELGEKKKKRKNKVLSTGEVFAS